MTVRFPPHFRFQRPVGPLARVSLSTMSQVKPSAVVLALCLLGVFAVVGAEDTCFVDAETGTERCDTNNTLLFDNTIKLNGKDGSGSWFTDLYDTVTGFFTAMTDTTSTGAGGDSKEGFDWEKEFEKIDMDDFLAEANKLAAMMATDNFGFNGEDIEKFAALTKKPETDTEIKKSDYEYQGVTRREPGAVGEETLLEIGDDEPPVKLIARAIDPPLYEIPNFLSGEDCDYIIKRASEKGMQTSRLFKNKDSVEKAENADSSRISESAALEASELDSAFLERHLRRVARLAGVPVEVVRWSEELAIGKYGVGGHYHAHLDSTDLNNDKVCCFQKSCTEQRGIKDVINTDCCRLCRYATVLFYLNDVEEGGETAFPLADYTYSQIRARSDEMEWANLTAHCHDAPVTVRPQKGKAILWYNHFTDKQGYLGGLSKRSYHGGCDVTSGTKWIATNWISIPTYKHRFIRSKHRLDGDE